MSAKDDLLFLSGNFMDFDLPPEKRYLVHYFPTGVQRQFLVYYLAFGNFDHFVDHSGYYSTKRWLQRLRDRMSKLETARKKAREAIDLTLLAQIETGDYPI